MDHVDSGVFQTMAPRIHAVSKNLLVTDCLRSGVEKVAGCNPAAMIYIRSVW